MRGRRRTPGRPVTYGTTDAFLEHYGLASLADLPGAAEMKAAGLLDLDLPAGFSCRGPGRGRPTRICSTRRSSPDFHRDFLAEGETAQSHRPRRAAARLGGRSAKASLALSANGLYSTRSRREAPDGEAFRRRENG